jgi:hypothetical protein
MECFKILKEYNNNKELAKPALSNYSNSFLYYILYNSPMVTKIKITKEKILIDVI